MGSPPAPAHEVLEALSHRGPDDAGHVYFDEGGLYHTRLSIIDPQTRSRQPFVYGAITLVFNGEIWNYRWLREQLEAAGKTFATESDTEVLAAWLDEHGWKEGLPVVRGMFAAAWKREGDPTIYLARDPYGETPLHLARTKGGWAFASELKVLRAMGAARGEGWVAPGTVVALLESGPIVERWFHRHVQPLKIELDAAAQKLREYIGGGSLERQIADVPVCTLLSGGIDSAAVAYHLRQVFPSLKAYCATLEGQSGKDVACAREVAEALEIDLEIVEVPAPTGRDLAEVVRHIEMPHKAQVEIGWACLHLAQRMQSDGFKVTFSGEGSDELWASYGFAYHALVTQGQDWYRYRADLFETQHRKNFARCNKIFMAHGVECRLPFLSEPLVEFALNLPPEAVQDGKAKPKAVIQRAYEGLLPESVTRRAKLAFQDGAGLKDAAAAAVPDPKRLYAAEFGKLYA